MMYVYIQSEPGLYTVGFYDPDGQWQPESDWNTRAEAASRVAWLNGSPQENAVMNTLKVLDQRISRLEDPTL